MLKATVLYSGSEGNATLVSDGTTDILIDAGGNEKRLKCALEACGKTPDELSAILITHEHTDHTKALYTLLKHYHIPIYTSINTARGICSVKNTSLDTLKAVAECVNTVEKNMCYEIGTMLVTPFLIPHDVEAHGFKICETGENKILCYATDTGCVTKEMMEHFKGAHLAVIESNHDVDMLIDGTYPEFLKQRILSNEGHLSNEIASRFALWLVENGTEKIILAHLSKENNTPTLAKNVTRSRLDDRGFSNISVNIASPVCATEESI